MDPLITPLMIAGTLASTIVGGVLEGQSDKYFCSAVRQLKEKFSLSTPVENHHLVTAFRRSCLKATLQICSRRGLSSGGQSSLLGMLYGASPVGLMAQDELEWLKRADAYLKAKIDELNKNLTYLPEQPNEKYQTLVNPAGVSSRERADNFRADLTEDAIAEVRDAAGEPPERFNDEMHADWFSLVCNDFQDALSANHDLANRFQNVTLVEIVSGVDTLKFGIEEILSLLKNRDAVDDNQPLAVFNLLNLEEKVYDREDERAAILEALGGALEDDRGRFLLVTAPSGFGKSFLLTKVLQQVTDGRAIREPYRRTVSKILRVDCRATQNVGGIVGDAGSLVGKSKALRLNYDLSREQNEPIAEWLNKYLFPALQQEGTAWLLLENFEAWLDAANGYAVKDASLRQFLNALFDGNHSLRVLFLSQDDPEPDVKRRLKKLERISEAIYQGLPEADALAYLRTEGADVGLDRADEELLKEFLRRIHHIPQALASLVGYLRSIEGYAFQEFMADEELWAGFDAYEGIADTGDKGIRRTKALIRRQIARQSNEVKHLLCALTFFERDVPKQALELLFDKKSEAATAIARLTAHKLATTKTGPRGTTRYDLHAYFREQTAKNLLPQFAAWLSSNGVGYAVKLYEAGMAAHAATKYRLATDLFSLVEKITRHLLETLKASAGDDEATKQDVTASLENALAAVLMMRGNSLNSLGQLREALSAHDEAIAQFQPLAESGKATFNDLAGAYVNKGIVLAKLGRLKEAVAELDKAIERLELLVAGGREELANDLADAYVNKGNVLNNLGLLSEAVAEYDKAIGIYGSLVAGGREELANDLAAVYVNKGAALRDLDRSSEAVAELDKAIGIREPLVAGGREELADDLAKARGNKANVLQQDQKWDEALSYYQQAIEAWEICVAQLGLFHLMPNLLKCFRLRVSLWLKLERWAETASDTLAALSLVIPYVEHDQIPDELKQAAGGEMGGIVADLRELSPEQRAQLYAAGGEAEEMLRRLIEG